VFSTGNFRPQKPPHEPFQEDRVVGAAVLLFCFVLCLMFVLSIDAIVINPFNATQLVTQTWQAQHPPTSTPIGTLPNFRSPRQATLPAPTDNNDNSPQV
jgi:hypothetical protein